MKVRCDHRSFKNGKFSPKLISKASTGLEAMASTLALLYQLSCEDPYFGSRAIYRVHFIRDRNET